MINLDADKPSPHRAGEKGSHAKAQRRQDYLWKLYNAILCELSGFA